MAELRRTLLWLVLEIIRPGPTDIGNDVMYDRTIRWRGFYKLHPPVLVKPVGRITYWYSRIPLSGTENGLGSLK